MEFYVSDMDVIIKFLFFSDQSVVFNSIYLSA